MTPPAPVELRLLGPVELRVDSEPRALPRSKKCRALLAYLAVTGRPHRRDQLCALLWDVADDPRGALRWTLSRLRSVMPKTSDPFDADRQSIALHPDRVRIDARALASLGRTDLSKVETETLEAVASSVRGELMEGLELPDFLEFTAWCIAQREELRRIHSSVLQELVGRHQDDPTRALPWARSRVQVDALDVVAHQSLLSLLLAQGFAEEAERRFEHAARQFRELSAPEGDALTRAWRSLRGSTPTPAPPRPTPPAAPPRPAAPVAVEAGPTTFVGRKAQLDEIRALFEADTRGSNRAVLVTAEPGGGKSRLLERLRSVATDADLAVLSARSFDLERGRPFGPWIDALGVASDELAEIGAAGGRGPLFEKLRSLVHDAGHGRRGVVLVLDDIQWLDPDSAEVLQYVLQTYDQGLLVALLAARSGELPDNPSARRVVGTLRRERMLREIELEPLTSQEVAALIGSPAGLDVDGITRASAGNPLYAMELARGAQDGHEGAPPSLTELLRERLSRLTDAALDVLRWAAVLGYTFDAAEIESLGDLPQTDLVDALEELERHALLRIDAGRREDRYAFAHDVVRESVYGELSRPRKRLMHRKVARLLQAGQTEPATAYEVARHASLAGEAELGVEACIAAAQYALRTCANADAEALARRGLHHVAELDETTRVAASLELLHVLYSAKTPDHDEAAERVRNLAERALDLGLTRPARIGFQMLSYLRWESSSMAAAHANILQAERVSRSADPDERSQALAHAARCLVLLERNLGQAEAFVMEAKGVTDRSGRSSAAVAFAVAMIAAHRGEYEVADASFAEAQQLARLGGERLAEFGSMEHRLMLALDRDEHTLAKTLAGELVELGTRVRPGAEVAIARALCALTRFVNFGGDETELAQTVEDLRTADAKYELSFVLTRWAAHTLERGDLEAASALAQDGVEVARAIGRASEIAVATAIRADICRRRGETDAAESELGTLEGTMESDLSATARRWLQRARPQ